MTTQTVAAETLSDKGHWDSVHHATAAGRSEANRSHGFKARLKRLLGPKFVASFNPYDDYLLWETILPGYFEGRAGGKALEIGSAPGEFLVRLKERFAITPFGVEYSASGAQLNRRLFGEHGIDPANVIEADFFEMCKEKRYQSAFDIVFSRGFIEHFRNPEDVVRQHVNLLRRGGLLFIAIPNLRGFNRVLCSMFNPELIAIHNLEIMTPKKLGDLIPEDLIQPLSCQYQGTFNFTLCYVRPDSRLRRLYAAGERLQGLLNVVFRFLFGTRGAESAWFSPSIVLFGIRR